MPSVAADMPSDELENFTAVAEVQTDPVVVHCDCCKHKQPKVKMSNFSIQYRPRMVDKGMQIFPENEEQSHDESRITEECNTNDKDVVGTLIKSKVEDNISESEDEDETEDEDDEDKLDDDDSMNDPDYDPWEDIGMDANEDEELVYVAGDVCRGRKFIVYEENLLAAFSLCTLCSSETESSVCAVQGTFCRIQQRCPSSNFKRYWESQPMIRNAPAGNVLLSAAIVFSGSNVSKALRMLNHFQCAAISQQTFFVHQRNFLLPSIEKLWEEDRKSKIQHTRQNEKLFVGSDGRCDSPGHSAKYGCYTLMDLSGGRILDVQLVQSNEVSSSSAMEKEGLIRPVNSLKRENVHIDVLVTDRHSQIKRWVRENMKGTVYKFDIWHIAKGIKKKN